MSVWSSKNPSAMVLMCSFNVRGYLEQTLYSIERAMEGKDWIFLCADDGSDDLTKEYLEQYKSGANQYIFKSFPKAVYLGEAKNRVFKMALPYRKSHEAVLIQDADDLMVRSKITKLLPYAVEQDSLFTIGSHVRLGGYSDSELTFHVNPASFFTHEAGLWNAILHSSLIPDDGEFYSPQWDSFDDGKKNSQFLVDKVFAKYLDVPTYIYIRHSNSVYNPSTEEENLRRQQKFIDAKYEIFAGKTIDLGIKVNLSIYSIFKNGDDVNKFLEILSNKFLLINKFVDLEFILVDTSSKLELASNLKYLCSKEIAIGIFKIIESKNEDYKEITNKIIKISKGGKLLFCTQLSEINQFLISTLLDNEIETVKIIKNSICFRRDFLIKINQNTNLSVV